MNIFIAGLSYNLSEAELEELFAEYGEVSSAKVIFDRETGRSRGFAFVEMTNDAEGQAVPKDMDLLKWQKMKPETKQSKH